MRRTITALTGTCALFLTLAGCGGTGDDGAPSEQATAIGDVKSADQKVLGGAEAVKAMDDLYQAAQDKKQTTVTIYGPGEPDRESLYDRFSQRFPGIKVENVYILGPEYAAKLEGEFASGQHVADLVQAGDTSIAGQIGLDYFIDFDPVTADGLDMKSYSDPTGTVMAASALPFGFMYNTNEMKSADAPAGWEDLVDPKYRGKMTSDDVTEFGGGFSTLSHMLWDGRYDEQYLEQLAAQDLTFQASLPVAGTAVATGEYAMDPFYPLSFYMRDKKKGAPVDFVFPTEGGVHISPHYLAVINGAPNQEAAELLMTWLFTPEAQEAAAGVGYYPLMPDEQGPADYPPADELDLLKPFPLEQVNKIAAGNLALTQSAFGN
jgi:iron(III) transport system substrate-binding protein